MSSATLTDTASIRQHLQNGGNLDRIVVRHDAPSTREFKTVMNLAKEQRIKVHTLSTVAFQREYPHAGLIVGIKIHYQGIELDDILNDPARYSKLLILDHIQDPHNFGAIIRSAEAFGIQAILYPKDRQVQITSSVVNASAGAIHHIALCKITNLINAVRDLKDHQFWVYGTHTEIGDDIDQWTPHTPVALIMGSEHKGISAATAKHLDGLVRIPLHGKTSSLNVSVATGIFLHRLSQLN